jgi:hypothetical protein
MPQSVADCRNGPGECPIGGDRLLRMKRLLALQQLLQSSRGQPPKSRATFSTTTRELKSLVRARRTDSGVQHRPVLTARSEGSLSASAAERPIGGSQEPRASASQELSAW